MKTVIKWHFEWTDFGGDSFGNVWCRKNDKIEKRSLGDNKCGYLQVSVYNNKERGYPKVHRFIMECFLGRRLVRGEIVDHINGKSMDNRIANLQIITQSENLLKGKKSKPRPTEYWYGLEDNLISLMIINPLLVDYFLDKARLVVVSKKRKQPIILKPNAGKTLPYPRQHMRCSNGEGFSIQLHILIYILLKNDGKPIPSGKVVSHKDGDMMNCNPNNLELTSRAI